MTLGNDNGTDGQTDRRTDRVQRNMRPDREEGRIKSPGEVYRWPTLGPCRYLGRCYCDS